MKNFFTSIERTNEQYIGTVHDSSTSQAVYRTQQYSSHSEAIIDVNRYLQTVSGEQIPQTINNTTTYQEPVVSATTPEFVPPKRCCGR